MTMTDDSCTNVTCDREATHEVDSPDSAPSATNNDVDIAVAD